MSDPQYIFDWLLIESGKIGYLFANDQNLVFPEPDRPDRNTSLDAYLAVTRYIEDRDQRCAEIAPAGAITAREAALALVSGCRVAALAAERLEVMAGIAAQELTPPVPIRDLAAEAGLTEDEARERYRLPKAQGE